MTMGQVVEITGDYTVAKPTTNPTLKRMGICLTSAASGKSVSVLCRGLARAKAYGTVTAGDKVGSGPGGTIQTIADVAAGDLTSSGAIATAINNTHGKFAVALQGAASGGNAVILMT